VSLNPHNYRRPGWRCVECGEEWPCPARREFWLGKYPSPIARLRLRGILGALQLDAEKDLRVPFLDLDERFVGWTYARAE
jgi:hypothetical protein